MTDMQSRRLSYVERAEKLGTEHGRAMATWSTDDRTDHAALLTLIEDGDPTAYTPTPAGRCPFEAFHPPTD